MMTIAVTACQGKKAVIYVEEKYKVEEIKGDPNSYKISKALYARLLKIIKRLGAEKAKLELELEAKNN